MRADRPASRTSTVPRLCYVLTAAASGVVLSMAARAPVHAQTPPGAAQSSQVAANDQGELFRMPEAASTFGSLTTDPRAPVRFRRTGASAGPTRFGQLQVYGTPPAAGAGAT